MRFGSEIKSQDDQMKIGILSPITIQEFLPYLDQCSKESCAKITGLRGPSVDVIVHELLRAGHTVVIFTLDPTVKETIKLTGERLTIYIGEYRTNVRVRALTFFYKEVSQLRGYVKKEKCDIVHAHWTYEFALGALKAECPVLITIRDIASKILRLHRNGYRLIRWLMDRWVFLHKGRVIFIANSAYVQEKIRKEHRVDSIIIPNPVSDAFVSMGPRVRKGNILISIANGWSEGKNIDTLILAFQEIRKNVSDAQLWLVGEDFRPDHPSVENLKRKNIHTFEEIRLLGKVEHDELPNLLSQVDVMVHPSLEESFGNTLIEAMAQGIPVIGGGNSGAVPWVLGNGQAGILCDVTSSYDIADKAIKILTNQKSWEKYSEAGRSYVGMNFTSKSVMEKTMSVYVECLKQRLPK
jgi:L-malate glycosyltransferase